MPDTGDPVPPEQLPAPQRIEGVGNVRFPISANAQPKMWFEQGYNLLYDFWDYEADRAFEQAIRSDPNCAMCYLGALPGGELQPQPTKTLRVRRRSQKAVALEGLITAREKLYIQGCRGPRGSGSRSQIRRQRKIRPRNRNSPFATDGPSTGIKRVSVAPIRPPTMLPVNEPALRPLSPLLYSLPALYHASHTPPVQA